MDYRVFDQVSSCQTRFFVSPALCPSPKNQRLSQDLNVLNMIRVDRSSCICVACQCLCDRLRRVIAVMGSRHSSAVSNFVLRVLHHSRVLGIGIRSRSSHHEAVVRPFVSIEPRIALRKNTIYT